MSKGNRSEPGNGSAAVVSLAALKGEIASLKILKGEAPDEEFEFALTQAAKRFDIPKRKLRYWVDDVDRDAQRGDRETLPITMEEANKRVDGLKQDLVIEMADLPAAAESLRDIFAATGYLFERAQVLVKVVSPADGGMPELVPLTVEGVVTETHRLRRPVKLTPARRRSPFTLPDRVARLYLDRTVQWNLPHLVGITTAPLLDEDGNIRIAEGYDRETRLWCCNVPTLELPERPSKAEAQEALQKLRAHFATFAFADAVRRRDAAGLELVDLTVDPGCDEGAFLTGLMTAVCRASLFLAPGMMLSAPQMSGSGSGKGLLAKAACLIAFGLRPVPFTAGSEELERTLGAVLLEGGPYIFFDNVNDAVLGSRTLEGAMTERPFRIRLFHTQKTGLLDGGALITVTGNALRPSGDLVRRFPMWIRLDARMENPALRQFPLADEAFLADTERRRPELLAAVLTIWRWGRQQGAKLPRGEELGSYSTWCQWCRDPLVALGCADPVKRMGELTMNDPTRGAIGELFGAWWEHHQSDPVPANKLHPEVRKIANPEDRPRQWLTTYLDNLHRTRVAEFMFERNKEDNWRPATYTLIRVE